ncbi:hypothetical protein Tco_1002920, partial [Tanacetum coccineum]
EIHLKMNLPDHRIKLWWKWRYLVPVESIHSPMLTLNVFNQRHHDNRKTYNTASATLITLKRITVDPGIESLDFLNESLLIHFYPYRSIMFSYVKDIFDRIDRNQQSNSMKISNIENLASKMSIQFSQLGAGNMKRIYESSIGVEIEKMNVETIALGSRKCEFGQELEKVQIAHNPFDETPKENFEVVHKVFDGMPNKNVY